MERSLITKDIRAAFVSNVGVTNMDMELLAKLLGGALIFLAFISYLDRTTPNKSHHKGDYV